MKVLVVLGLVLVLCTLSHSLREATSEDVREMLGAKREAREAASRVSSDALCYAMRHVCGPSHLCKGLTDVASEEIIRLFPTTLDELPNPMLVQCLQALTRDRLKAILAATKDTCLACDKAALVSRLAESSRANVVASNVVMLLMKVAEKHYASEQAKKAAAKQPASPSSTATSRPSAKASPPPPRQVFPTSKAPPPPPSSPSTSSSSPAERRNEKKRGSQKKTSRREAAARDRLIATLSSFSFANVTSASVSDLTKAQLESLLRVAEYTNTVRAFYEAHPPPAQPSDSLPCGTSGTTCLSDDEGLEISLSNIKDDAAMP